jgi:ATP-binding cassette, subfamily B, bacterial
MDRFRDLLGVGQFSRRGALVTVLRTSLERRPWLTAAAVLTMVISGLLPGAAYLTAGRLIDAVGSGDGYLRWVVWAAVVALLIATVPAINDAATATLAREIELEFRNDLLTTVSSRLSVAQLEQPAVQELVAASRGLVSEDRGPGATVRGYGHFLPNKLAGLFLIGILASFHWWLGVAVLVSSLLIRRMTLVLWFRSLEVLHGDVDGIRRADYLRNLALQRDTAREVQLFGLGDWIVLRHAEQWTRSMRSAWERRSVVGIQMLAVAASVFVVAGLAAVVIVQGLVGGQIGAGDAVALSGALTALIYLGGLQPEADMPIRYGFESVQAVQQAKSMALGRHPGAGTTTGDPEDGPVAISVDNLSFEYLPQRPVLKNVSFRILPGQTVAFVGENGAGKTTLMKLMAGLLEPSEGGIASLLPDGARRRYETHLPAVSAVFQDFGRYELSLRDNVCLGRDASGRFGEERFQKVVQAAGITALLEALPDGAETVLSASHPGGVDLSGGQWQRVALARALYGVESGSSLLILDEPTASLDIRGELEFFDELMVAAATTTKLLVSHRFSTVRRADLICVMERGEIVETGSHTELMNLKGRYAEMYGLQADRYVS